MNDRQLFLDKLTVLRQGNPAPLPELYLCFSRDDDDAAWQCAEAIAHLLDTLPPGRLVRLRAAFQQRTSLDWSIDWRRVNPMRWAARLDRDGLFAVLAAGTFHPNGYYREQCLRQLAPFGGKALPFALLLSNNWVAQVREQALTVSLRMIAQADADALLHALPYLVAVRRGGRRDSEVWDALYAAFRDRLREHADQLQPGKLMRLDTFTRRTCYGMLRDLGMLSQEDMVRLLARDRDAFNQLRLARYLLEQQPVPGHITDDLLRHKVAAIRRLALQHRFAQGGIWPGAEAFLFDRNDGVRDLARFLLRGCGVDDIPGRYRRRVAADPVPGAVQGLGEVGDAADMAMIMPFLDAAEPAMLRAALSAAALLGGSGSADLLYRYLSHPHGGKTAYRHLLRLHVQPLCIRCCEDYGGTADPVLRHRLFRLVCLGNRWDLLACLIRLYPLLADDDRQDAEKMMLGWQVGFTSPSARQRGQLDALLEQNLLPDNILSTIRFTLSRAKW